MGVPRISIAPSSPVTAVIQTLFVDSTVIEEMSWQDDTRIANAAPDMPQNQVKFTPETILWQRNRMVLSDLQVDTQISFFGVDLGNIAYADYMVILAEPTQDFVKNGVNTSDHLGVGKIASIMPAPTGWSIKVEQNGNSVEIRTTQSTRVFRQQRTTLAALEVGSEVFYQGRLLQNGSEMLTEVAKVVILYVPSQSIACYRSVVSWGSTAPLITIVVPSLWCSYQRHLTYSGYQARGTMPLSMTKAAKSTPSTTWRSWPIRLGML